MAITYQNSFVTQWNDEVFQLYQQKGSKLRNAVRTVTGVTGSTHKFHTLGSVSANTKNRNADVTALEPAHAVVTATLADAYAPMYIDKLDALKTNADFRREYVLAGAMALGRKTDDIIVAAADAATPGTTIAHGSAGLTYAKLTSALTALNSSDVDQEDRFLVVSPEAINDALGLAELKSVDYTAIRNVMNGSVQYALGFNWIMSTRLSVATNIRSCYAFSRQAIGLAIGQDIVTEVNYVPEKVAWLINSYLSMGAAIIDTNGLVEVQVDES